MQVILHTGVHCTDEDRLLKCLLRNADGWRHDGVAVPGPGRYRQLLSDLVNAMGEEGPAADAREVLLDAILTQDPEMVDRVILSHENLFSVPKLALSGGRIYRKAETRLAMMQALFPGDTVTLCMGLRNPATYLPAVFGATPHADFGDFLHGTDPMDLRWSDLVRRIRSALPEMPMVLWCNEDTPFLWGEILRRMGGVPMTQKVVGAFDVFSDIVSPVGIARFRDFLKDNPVMSEAHRRRVMAAILARYGIPEKLEEELDLPGWDCDYVARLTAGYDADMERVAAIPGVTLLMP